VDSYIELNQSRTNIGDALAPFKQFGKQGLDGLIDELSARILNCTNLKLIQLAETHLKDGLAKIDLSWKVEAEHSKFVIDHSLRCQTHHGNLQLWDQQQRAQCVICSPNGRIDHSGWNQGLYYYSKIEVESPVIPVIVGFISKLVDLLKETIDYLPEVPQIVVAQALDDAVLQDEIKTNVKEYLKENQKGCQLEPEPKPLARSWNVFRADEVTTFRIETRPYLSKRQNIAKAQFRIADLAMMSCDLSKYQRCIINELLDLMGRDTVDRDAIKEYRDAIKELVEKFVANPGSLAGLEMANSIAAILNDMEE
jgi:hypothetical protein